MWGWLTGRRPSLQVILYTRQACPLCEEAWAILEAEQRTWGFQLSLVDVDSDPRLLEAHGDSVPVVTVDGVVRFRGKVSPILFRRLLR
jgi:glutaredoxin